MQEGIKRSLAKVQALLHLVERAGVAPRADLEAVTGHLREMLHHLRDEAAELQRRSGELSTLHASLVAAGRRLAEVLEEAPVAVVVTDPLGVVTGCNEQAAHLLGFPRGGINGKHLRALIGLRGGPLFGAVLAGALASRDPVTWRGKLRIGERPASRGSVRVHSRRDRHGVPETVVWILESEAEAHDRVRAAERHWAEITGAMPAVLLELDPQGVIVSASRRLGERPLDTLVGMSALDIFAASDRGLMRLAHDRSVREGATSAFEARASARVGGHLLLATVVPVLKYGRTDRSLLVVREPRGAQGDREQPPMDRDLIARALRGLSHDLKNPLSAIAGLSEVMEQHLQELPPEQISSILSRIASNARQLVQITEELETARGALLPNVLRREELDLGALVRTTAQAACTDDHPLRVSEQPVPAFVDRAKVTRIVQNLVTNACRHTPPGTAVYAAAHERKEGWEIEVTDEGDGIPVERRHAVFREFDHAGGDGRGIGLAVVADLAAMHDGSARVEDRPGGGASLRVFLARVDVPV